jgi:hypothetical protein
VAERERQANALDVRSPDFYVFTDAMKAHEDDGDRPTVLCTASSTAVDLEADRFTAPALKQMKEGFVGKLIFLNHSYKVPHDVFGLVLKAELVKRENRLDLDLVIGVEMNNPLAVQTYQYVVNGTRLGVSVGVLVTEAEKSDEEDEYGKNIFDISGVIPLEASVVGIPANQTAWTRQAIKSLFARGALNLDDVDIESRPWLKTIAQDKEAAEAPYDELGVIRGAVGSHSPTKAPQDRAWTASSAVKRLRSWAGGPAKDDINWSKYRTGFTWFNASEKESFGSYKLPHHDIVNSSFVVVFRGAVAAAVVIQGGRGGVNIPDGDMGSVKAHIAKHYHQFDEKAPWEREKDDGWLAIELEIADELMAQGVIDEELPAFGKATWPEEKEADDMATMSDEERAAAEAAAAAEGSEDKSEEKDTSAEKDETKEEPEAKGESESKDDNSDETKEEPEEKDETKEEPEAKKDDFEDDVAADEAADLLIDKMYTGFRVAINNLIGIILNTDLSPGDRAKQGAEVIESWKDYIEESWEETIDHLDESKAVESNESFNVDAHLHDLIAEEEGVECDVAGFEGVAAKVKDIGDSAEAIAEDNTQLREENEQKAKAIKYMQQVLEVLMALPLQTVTTGKGQVSAQSLAERFPALDTRVVERMARFAPPDPQQEE